MPSIWENAQETHQNQVGHNNQLLAALNYEFNSPSALVKSSGRVGWKIMSRTSTSKKAQRGVTVNNPSFACLAMLNESDTYHHGP